MSSQARCDNPMQKQQQSLGHFWQSPGNDYELFLYPVSTCLIICCDIQRRKFVFHELKNPNQKEEVIA